MIYGSIFDLYSTEHAVYLTCIPKELNWLMWRGILLKQSPSMHISMVQYYHDRLRKRERVGDWRKKRSSDLILHPAVVIAISPSLTQLHCTHFSDDWFSIWIFSRTKDPCLFQIYQFICICTASGLSVSLSWSFVSVSVPPPSSSLEIYSDLNELTSQSIVPKNIRVKQSVRFHGKGCRRNKRWTVTLFIGRHKSRPFFLVFVRPIDSKT